MWYHETSLEVPRLIRVLRVEIILWNPEARIRLTLVGRLDIWLIFYVYYNSFQLVPSVESGELTVKERSAGDGCLVRGCLVA